MSKTPETGIHGLPSRTDASNPVVFVVDDDPSILDLIRVACNGRGWVVQTFTSGRAFLDVIRPADAGCLILDYLMPDTSGLELMEELHGRGVQLPVIFISGKAQVSTAVQAFKAGSLDFLEKPFSIADLHKTIDRALERDAALRRERADLVEVTARVECLTPREREVMQHVVDGLPNKEVATKLGVSPKTIEVHRANVMMKMRADSLADLVKMAVFYQKNGRQDEPAD